MEDIAVKINERLKPFGLTIVPYGDSTQYKIIGIYKDIDTDMIQKIVELDRRIELCDIIADSYTCTTALIVELNDTLSERKSRPGKTH